MWLPKYESTVDHNTAGDFSSLNGQGYRQLLRILSHPERVGKMAVCNRVDLTALNKA